MKLGYKKYLVHIRRKLKLDFKENIKKEKLGEEIESENIIQLTNTALGSNRLYWKMDGVTSRICGHLI